MGAKVLVAVGTSLLVVCALAAQQSGAAQGGNAGDPANRLVATPASELKWGDLDPVGAPGVKIAPLWGDPAKGAFGAYLRLPAGFTAPLHTHSHDMRVVFISGTYVQRPEGRPEFRLGPGSYMMQPGGEYRHVTSCEKGSDCVFLVNSDGPFDLKLVEDGTTPEKR